jgi:hypothetical protein
MLTCVVRELTVMAETLVIANSLVVDTPVVSDDHPRRAKPLTRDRMNPILWSELVTSLLQTSLHVLILSRLADHQSMRLNSLF